MSNARSLASFLSGTPTTDFNFDSNSLVVDISENSVGIGTNAPDELLHLVSSTSLEPVLKLENTNDNNLNAQIHLVKNPATGGAEADDDYLGQVDFKGLNDVDASPVTFGRLQCQAKDVSDGTEDGRVYLAAMNAGTLEETLNVVSGKVGIGTTAPEANLEIEGTSAGLLFQLGAESGVNCGYMGFEHEGSHIGFIGGGAGLGAPANDDFVIRVETSTDMHFLRGTTEAMVLKGDTGNVGIGTTAPVDNLHAIGTLRINETTTLGHQTNAGTAFEIRGDALASGSTDVDAFKAFKIAHNDASEYGGQAQFSLGRWEENGSDARSSLVISLGHGGLNSSSNADVDVMTLRSDGNVGIGTTAPSRALSVFTNTSGGGYVAEFINDGNTNDRGGIIIQAGEDTPNLTNYYIVIKDGNGNDVLYAMYNGSNHLFTTASDQRLKTDIKDTNLNGLETLNKIKTRDFKWKKSGVSATGFIAQELNEIYPEAVGGNEDDEDHVMSVSKEALVPVLVKAVQELSAKVKELENS